MPCFDDAHVTIEQRKDEERHWLYVERNDLRPIMNDTKWREAISALQAIPSFPVRFRARNVRDPIDTIPYWDSSCPWHVPTYWSIEWLDIDPILPDHLVKSSNFPVHDFTNAVKTALQNAHVPFTHEGRFIRIWGYLRSDTRVVLS